MIVLRRDSRLLLIRQLDHAALAGRFAEFWGNTRFCAPKPLAPVVLAASRHDEGWREWDDAVRHDETARAPLYFLDVDIRDYVGLYARGIDRIAALDPYAGLLVSMHGTGNVCGRWGLQSGIRLSGYDAESWPPVIERYVLEQEARQARLRLGLVGLDPGERRSCFERRLWSNYELLQAWDRLSLFLCRTDPAAIDEADLGVVPTSLEGIEAAPLAVTTLGGGRAEVRPWPFDRERLEIAVPVREIPAADYTSQAELRTEVDRAAVHSLAWTLAAPEANANGAS
jgi:Protein of unknown function (DUF3891)